MRRIGLLTSHNEGDPRAQSAYMVFRRRLQELGWSVGRNLQIEHRWAGGKPDLLRANAAELVALKPDALHVFSTPATAALQQETHSIPIVFVSVSDPIGSGFVQSLAHPGGNATGWTNYVPTMPGKWLQLVKEIAPRIRRAGAIFNPITAPYVTKFYLPALQSAAPALGIEVIAAPVKEPADIETVLSQFAQETDAVIVMPDTFTIVNRGSIIKLTNQNRVPTIYPYRYVGQQGGLITYGADEIDYFLHSAEYIHRILNGANPGDLPVQAPTKFELVINLKTAKALGLTVPPTLLARADEVIE